MIQPKGPKIPAPPEGFRDPVLEADLAGFNLSLADIIAASERAQAKSKSTKAARKAEQDKTRKTGHRLEYKRLQANLTTFEQSKKVFSELCLYQWKPVQLILKTITNTCLTCGSKATIPQAKDAVMLRRVRQTKKGLESWYTPALLFPKPGLERIFDDTKTTSVICPKCFSTSTENDNQLQLFPRG